MKYQIADQISALEATIDDAMTKRKSILERAQLQERSLSDAERVEFDTIGRDIDRLQGDLARCKATQADMATARPVDDQSHKGMQVRAGIAPSGAQARNTQTLDAGIGFARVARCVALSHIHHQNPAQIAKTIYPDDDQTIGHLTRTAVPAANTGSATWAGNLITDGGVAFADFVEFLRPRTLLGRISDRLRNLPFDTPVLIQSTGGTAKWVKEGAAKPLTKWQYTRTKLVPLKVAAIAAATKETLMRATPAADALLRDELARAVGATLDTTFIDPDAAAVTDESPASILNGVTPLTLSGGTDSSAVRCDVEVFMNQFADNLLSLDGAFWIMPERIAIALSLMENALGQQAFPGISFSGGTFFGLPVFITAYADTDSNGSVVALVRGDEIFLGDEGGIQVSMSDQASLLMDDAPNSSSVTPTAAQLVSLWQTNSVAFLVERFMNWQRRRAASVAWGRVNWSGCSDTSP
jgi:hypothetical protein